jgi:hypothetical protein
LCFSVSRPADGQFLKSPVFVAQPGMRTIDAISVDRVLGSSSGFNMRFATLIPTSSDRMRMQFGASFLPFGLSNGRKNDNDPVLFYGASFALIRDRDSGGWLELALPVQGVFQFNETGTINDPLYEHDLVLEGALTLHIGRKFLSDLGGFWSRVDLYGFIDQTLTPNADLTTGKRDRFAPALMYGLTLPIAGK